MVKIWSEGAESSRNSTTTRGRSRIPFGQNSCSRNGKQPTLGEPVTDAEWAWPRHGGILFSDVLFFPENRLCNQAPHQGQGQPTRRSQLAHRLARIWGHANSGMRPQHKFSYRWWAAEIGAR